MAFETTERFIPYETFYIMISFLEGILEETEATHIVLNVGGIGYEIFVTQTQNFKVTETYKIHTYVVYREDSQTLYGFIDKEQRNFFKLLVEKVNGVGPKVALAILAFFQMNDLCSIIFNDDADSLAKCPGIGKKTAQRLILELRDYLKKSPILKQVSAKQTTHTDAIEALIVLGYSRKQAERLIEKIKADITETDSVEAILKKVFKQNRFASLKN